MFATSAELDHFLSIMVRQPQRDRLYEQIVWTASDRESWWCYDVVPMDLNNVAEIFGPDVDPEWIPGVPLNVSLRFPRSDLAAVYERMVEFNRSRAAAERFCATKRSGATASARRQAHRWQRATSLSVLTAKPYGIDVYDLPVGGAGHRADRRRTSPRPRSPAAACFRTVAASASETLEKQ